MIIINIGTDFENKICHHSVLITQVSNTKILFERPFAGIIRTWSSRIREARE